MNPGASINIMSLFGLGLWDPQTISIILQLANRTLKHPYRVVDNMLIKVGNYFFFPADFIILDIDAQQMSLILKIPFLTTGRTLMDFEKVEILKPEEKQQSFTVNTPLGTLPRGMQND